MKGECTCGDISLIDYFLASSNLFPYIFDFEVKQFSPLLSDDHKQLHITLSYPKKNRLLREPDHSDNNNFFLSDLRYENIYNLVEVLEEKLNMGEEITDDSINLIVNEIGELFDDTAKTVFGIRKSPVNRLRQSYDKSQQTPWFNGVCKDKHEAFHYARKKYNVHKNDINRNRSAEVVQHSKGTRS